MKSQKILHETTLFKFFREFTTNTAFLAFPLIAEVVSSWILKLISPIHLFLLIGLLFQTYGIIKIKHPSFLKIFILNSLIPFAYLWIEFIDEWDILWNPIYILYFIFALANSLSRAGELYFEQVNKKHLNLYLKPLDISIKILVIPIFYFLLELLSKPEITFLNFYIWSNSSTHLFLLCIFLYLAIIFSVDLYLSEKRKHLLDNLLWILHKYSSYIVDSQDLEESIKTGTINVSSKKMYKSVVFMDIRWFTSWSENNKPEEVIHLLNGFYELAEETIGKYQSWKINKYVADEIVFVFDDLDEAIDFSLELKEKEIAYLDNFWLKVWFWINAWVLIYGWIGGNNKKEQTVIGDVVNTAARLEWWINQIKIPKTIVPNRYHVEDLWVLPLKWKSRELEIVEVISKK